MNNDKVNVIKYLNSSMYTWEIKNLQVEYEDTSNSASENKSENNV